MAKVCFCCRRLTLEPVLQRLEEFRPSILMVDSIQMLHSEDVPSGPGSVAQVREAGLQLTRWAKLSHVPILLAGHITKDGSVGGPPGAGAHGGRGRIPGIPGVQHLPDTAKQQEPVWLHHRGWRVRNDRPRTGRRAGPVPRLAGPALRTCGGFSPGPGLSKAAAR